MENRFWKEAVNAGILRKKCNKIIEQLNSPIFQIWSCMIPTSLCVLIMASFRTGEGVDYPAAAGHWKDIANERVQFHQNHHHSNESSIPVLVVHKWYFNLAQTLLYVHNNYHGNCHDDHDQRWNNNSKVEGHLSAPANIWYVHCKGIPFHNEFNL